MRIEHTNGYKGGAKCVRPASDPVTDPVLDRVVAEDLAERRHAVAKLDAVLDWAHAHPGTAGDCASWDPALWVINSEDGLDHLGGAGTPAVAEFAVEQLATSLGVSTGVAMQLVADTLDLAYRHPLLWARLRAGAVPVWIARKITAACSSLPVEAAAYVDSQTAHLAGRVPWRRIEAHIAYAVATWNPEKTAEAEAQARDSRHVHVFFPTRGTLDGSPARPGDIAAADLRGRLSAIDALKFDALVTAKAAELATAGDTDPLDVRRSKALGLIADQLITGELDLDLADAEDSSRKSALPATLYVHVNAEDLAAHATGTTSIGVAEKLGPTTLDLIADWLADTDLSVRPVLGMLDMGRTDAVDAHDPPEWMRELVTLRDRHCVFPHCNRPARSCDLDHIDPYLSIDQGGPPGQTSPANLAPLCRRHHRCKTFTRWRYQRLPTGDYQWTDPSGRTFPAPL